MGLFVNPDNSAFQAALNARIYVDKSGMLNYTNSVLESTEAYICNSRPRRFGKSTAADMLTAYYSRGCDSREMFMGLEISESPDFNKYLNKYDVIHIDVQWCLEPAGNAENVVPFITKNVLSELRAVYPEEVRDGVNSVSEALSLISAGTKKKFVVIIDEWDVLIRDEAAKKDVQESYISFLRGLFKGSLPTGYIAMAYLTGILPIKKLGTQSALNNFDEFTMLTANEMAPYMGFTEEEVRNLCEVYGKSFADVKRWYDGYLIDGYQIYNPKAVVSVLTKGRLRSYWSETGTYDAVVPLINMDFDGLKTAIVEMISGTGVKVDVSSFQNDTVSFSNRDDVITYLIHLGYLGYDQEEKSAFVPNEEIRQELIAATKRKNWNEMQRFQKGSGRLLEATLQMDEAEVAEAVGKIHEEYASAI